MDGCIPTRFFLRELINIYAAPCSDSLIYKCCIRIIVDSKQNTLSQLSDLGAPHTHTHTSVGTERLVVMIVLAK